MQTVLREQAGHAALTATYAGIADIATPDDTSVVIRLKEGDPVRVSGVKKGQVVRVRLERKGTVVVTLSLDPEVRPHADAGATVASADFLGAKFVDYNPGVKAELFPVGRPIPEITR